MSRTRVTPEDLMEMVVAADLYRSRALTGDVTPLPPPLRHAKLESCFNIFGVLLGQLYVLLPWPLRWRADQRLNFLLAGRRAALPAEFAEIRQDVVAMAQRLRRETGQRAATLIFTSHPPTTGSLEWLRFELLRQGLLLANAVIDASFPWFAYHPRPECFLAIDPFALDTLTTPVAGLYSGLMHRFYFAFDRQSRTQGWLQRHLLLRKTGYPQIAERLLNRLKQDVPVIMVLPGGLPHNARLLYTAREFVLQLPVSHWPYSKRIAQQKWMDVLIRPVNGTRPCEKGELPPATQEGLRVLLTEWGLTGSEQDRWLGLFAEEFAREVPYRMRLFRLLLQRLVSQGKPLLWSAVTHQETAPYVRLSPPWGAYRDRQGRIQVLKGSQSAPEPLGDIQELAKAFTAQFGA